MDETVYQCPECNFNADNLTELDGHITEFHSNDLKNVDRNHLIDTDEDDQNNNNNNNNNHDDNEDEEDNENDDDDDDDGIGSNSMTNKHHEQNYQLQYQEEEEDEEIMIENDIPHDSNLNDSLNQQYSNTNMDDENEPFNDNDEYYYENPNVYGNKNNQMNIIQNRLSNKTAASSVDSNVAYINKNKSHNLRQKQPIDYNGLNGAVLANSSIQFSVPKPPPSSNKRSTQSVVSSSSSSVQEVSELNPSVPIINSDNHYERQYTCKRCGFFTNNPRAVLYHRKEFHFEKINIHECTYCQYASQYSGKVERHTLLRHKIDINLIPGKKLMSQKFKADKTLDNSSLNLTDLANQSQNDIESSLLGNTNRGVNLENTNSKIQSALSQKPNINQSDLSNLARFQCNKCPCKYKRSNDLYKHLKLKHGVLAQRLSDYFTNSPSFYPASTANANSNVLNETDQDPYDQDHNDQEAINEDQEPNENNETKLNDQYQQQEQSTTKTNSYECPYCTYYSNGNDAEYLLHVKDHLCGKSFRCVLCNSVYKYRGDCVVHLKRKHQKADLYAQNYVERFNLESLDISQVCALLKPKQQEETENEEKLFSCSYCDYKANYKGDVFKHQTRRHPGSPKNVTSLNPHLNMSGSENNGMLVGRHGRSNLNVTSSTGLYNGDNHNNINNNHNNNITENKFNKTIASAPTVVHIVHNAATSTLPVPSMIKNAHSTFNSISMMTKNNAKIAHKPIETDNEIIKLNKHQHQHQQHHHHTQNNKFSEFYYNNNQMKESQHMNARYIADKNNDDDEEEEVENEETIMEVFEERDQDEMFNNTINDEQGQLENYEIDEENNEQMNGNYEEQAEDLEVINDFVDQDQKQNIFSADSYHHSNDGQEEEASEFTDNFNTSNSAATAFNRFQCKFCSFVGKNQAKLQLHLATHYNLKPFVCPICNRRANFKWDIQKHLRKIHSDYVSEVICLTDAEARQSITSYIERKPPISISNTSHETSPAKSTTLINDLNENIRPTSSLSSMSQGSASRPEQTLPATDLLDDSSMANLRILARKRTQHALRERKFKCSLCNRTSKWQWDIRKHLRTVHRGQLGGDVIIIREMVINGKKHSQQIHQYSQQPKSQQIFQSIKPKLISQSLFGTNSNMNSLLSSKQSSQFQQLPQQKSHHQASMTQSPIIVSSLQATCSDPTGNKKFKCTVCPYRSNWKADLFRHLRKRHYVQQPQLENVIILDSDYAANSLEEYEQVHGIHVRKRSRTDLDLSHQMANSGSCSSDTNAISIMNESKRPKLQPYVDPDLIDIDDGSASIDQKNELQQQENNIEILNRNNRLPVSIAELNIKPYKCLKCGFRSDRKSDTLRHIRVKHMQTVNAVKFLRIMSIKEASDTIEAYENMRLYKKIKNFNSESTAPNIYEEALSQYESTVNINSEAIKSNEHSFIPDTPPSTSLSMKSTASCSFTSSNNNKSNSKPTGNSVEVETSPTINATKEIEECRDKAECCDYYRCPFCSFKNVSKLIMRRHLAVHFSSTQKIRINPVFRCNICSFKSKWKFSVKKHILMNHSLVKNAYVLKVVNNRQKSNFSTKQIQHDQEPEKEENKAKMPKETQEPTTFQEEEDEEEEEEEGEEEYDEEDYCEDECEEEEEGYFSHNKTENENCSMDDESNKTTESIILTDYDGVQFQTTFLVSNPLHHSIGSLNGQKKKVYHCQACPYKTSNYSNLRQHLLQHRRRNSFFKCRYCVYYVSKLRLLKQHEILHPEFELRLTAKQIKRQQQHNNQLGMTENF